MPGQQVAHVFGPNMPTRIAGTAQLLLEPGEVAPSLPWYQPLIPFYPPNITSGDASSSGTSTSGSDDWWQVPGKLDIFCYQGDDVQVPLFFSDPSDWEIDMSTAAGWEWKAQVRVLHRHWSTLVCEFVTAAEYIPPVPEDEQPQGVTQVTLFLPRAFNLASGEYHWDVQSVGPFTGPAYPVEPPAGWPEGEDWPPTTALKTWLYGLFTVVPRVTATEFLPSGVYVGGGGAVSAPVTTGGFVVGPNGRVP
jgi:hypothetical protein